MQPEVLKEKHPALHPKVPPPANPWLTQVWPLRFGPMVSQTFDPSGIMPSPHTKGTHWLALQRPEQHVEPVEHVPPLAVQIPDPHILFEQLEPPQHSVGSKQTFPDKTQELT